MKYKIILLLLFFLASCTTNQQIQNDALIIEKFSNSGFTLIYDPLLYKNKTINKKMNQRDLLIFQRNLRKGTSVKLTNPENNKTIIAKVGVSAKYPDFNNSVVSIRISKELELNSDEPFIYIEEIIGNDSFIAKKSKTFEEEKTVADKAPVETISINNLNESSSDKTKKIKNKRKFSYNIKIADFYYKSTANMMAERVRNEISLNNTKIEKISENTFRVLIGPFANLKTLQNAYNSVKKLDFENIEIIKNEK
tara:strand:- start:1496 stop:2251 length:756 start_codon:yes stop_codon:yes gene_type:complete